MKFHQIKSFQAEGIIEPKSIRNHPMQRFPQKFKLDLRPEVWELSENSAGVSISFFSNANQISIKWSLKHDNKMNHMTDAGIKGVDLYYKKLNKWIYINTGLPNSKDNEQVLFSVKSKKKREFRLHLPLYDTITDIQIGFDIDSKLEYVKSKKPPIIFYGTSITQGGCASRPGIAYTNIISRKLNYECINLGFSGNGHLENSIGKILSKIDAGMYVIECMPNINAEIVKKNIRPLIKEIRKNSNGHSAPIIFFEECLTNLSNLDQKLNNQAREKNFELKKQIDIAKDKGEKKIHILKQDGCFDHDSEFTVDGVHFNDLGFHRYAFHFIENIKKLNLLA